MLTQREKRLGDWAAGTIVIQAEPPVAAATFPVSSQAADLAMQLVQSKADLSQLLPDDFAVIREYLQRRRAMAPKARAQLSLQLAEQVKGIIALVKLPGDVTPYVFLVSVFLVYLNQ